MNLYLRLLWTLLRCWRMPRIGAGESIVRRLHVLPNDLDINGHMNNGRYLTVVDLMLTEYFVRSGFARVMLREGWKPMSGGSFISYRRGLRPFQTYELRFRLDACDGHWNYMHFEFASEGRVCAAGYMKGAAVARSGFVPNEVSYAKLGVAPPETPLPASVEHWLAAEREVMAGSW